MCTEFLVQITNVMNSGLNITPNPELDKSQLFHIFPKKMAPILILDNEKIVFRLSQYGIIPSWSKEAKVKFATHNARIESINEKPTWKKPFVDKHCLVPIDEFREPVRVGPHANSLISFRSEQHVTLLVAGVYDEWRGSNNEMLHSFAIITKEATPFILSMGHERSPIILCTDLARQWLYEKVDPKNYLNLLNIAKQPERLLVDEVRKLKVRV